MQFAAIYEQFFFLKKNFQINYEEEMDITILLMLIGIEGN